MGGRRFLAWHFLAIFALAGLLLGQSTTLAQGAPNRADDEQAIRQAAQEYLAALASGDAKAAAEFWTADGDLVDESGQSTPASTLLAELKQSAGARPRAEVRVKDSAIRFLTADVAIEDGTSETTAADSDRPAVAGRFLAVWVKQDGKWRLASLREARRASSPAAALAELDGLVGDWTGESDGTTFHVAAHWNAARTYLVRELTTLRDGREIFSGSQRIGWDPISGRIKSWVFDVNGGRGEATWTRTATGWTVQGTHILPGGDETRTNSTYILEGDDALIWKSIVTLPGGRTLAETAIELKRSPAMP